MRLVFVSPCSPIGPQDLLSRSLKQLYREIQQIRTTRDQVLLAHNQSQDQIAQLEAQLAQDQDQDQIAHSQAQLTLKQEQEESRQLKEDLEKLRDKLQRSENLQRQMQTTMVSKPN